MLIFEQKSGGLYLGVDVLGTGYAGRGVGRNNPLMQDVVGIGPLPCGFYTMLAPVDHPRVGKYAIELVPDEGNQMFGRKDFFLHGDSLEHPGLASDGCIVQLKLVRVRAWEENPDHRLQVISGIAPNLASEFNKRFGI